MCCSFGFFAAPGWDAVSGVGTPDYKVIANILKNPDNKFPAIESAPNVADTETDDEVKNIAISALVFSILSFVMLLFAIGYHFLSNKKINNNANTRSIGEKTENPISIQMSSN